MGYEQRYGALMNLAETIRGLEADRDRLAHEVERLTKERDEAIAKAGPIIEWVDAAALRRSDETYIDALQRLIDAWRTEVEWVDAAALRRSRQDAKELARLRSIIRQMIREEAERKIEALGVGEGAQ